MLALLVLPALIFSVVADPVHHHSNRPANRGGIDSGLLEVDDPQKVSSGQQGVKNSGQHQQGIGRREAVDYPDYQDEERSTGRRDLGGTQVQRRGVDNRDYNRRSARRNVNQRPFNSESDGQVRRRGVESVDSPPRTSVGISNRRQRRHLEDEEVEVRKEILKEEFLKEKSAKFLHPGFGGFGGGHGVVGTPVVVGSPVVSRGGGGFNRHSSVDVHKSETEFIGGY